jgi:hypothetical protein
MKGPDRPGLTTMEETMNAIKTAFAGAAFGNPGSDTFWLLIWILLILAREERREAEHRRERDAAPKLPTSPRP